MKPRFAIGGVCVAICLAVLAMPDQRTPENFRKLFADRGLELTSISPAGGCYRVQGYLYEARNASGRTESGHICVNKTLRVFSMQPRT